MLGNILGQFAAGCDRTILGAPMWYNGLPMDSNCAIKMDGMDMTQFVSIIVSNIIQIMLVLSAWICTGMIIYAGYQLVTSGGDAARVAKGKKTIVGAIIGLIISILGAAIVNFIASVLWPNG